MKIVSQSQPSNGAIRHFREGRNLKIYDNLIRLSRMKQYEQIIHGVDFVINGLRRNS